MDIPSRRFRKQKSRRWTVFGFIFSCLLLLGMAFIVYVAIHTGNYMGLAAIGIVIFFLLLGLNIGNIRRVMPGLSSEQNEIKFIAVCIYTCLGFVALTMASHLPKTKELLPLEITEISTSQQQLIVNKQENPPEATNNPVNDLPPMDADKTEDDLSKQQEEKIVQTTPVTKMEQATDSIVVTKIIDAQVIEINNQQLVRLIGVQVPDSMQAQATAFVEEMLNNRQVSLSVCTERPKDEYGRTRAVVIVNGVNVNQKLIEVGYSPLIITVPSSIDFTSWQSAEDLAKSQQNGIWAKHPQ